MSLSKLLYEGYQSIDDKLSSIQVEVHEDCPEINDVTIRVYHDGGYSFRIEKIDDQENDKFDYRFILGEDEFKKCDEILALRLLDETRKPFQIEKIRSNLIIAFKCPVCDTIEEGEEVEDLYNKGIRYKTMKHMQGVLCESCYSDKEIQNSSI